MSTLSYNRRVGKTGRPLGMIDVLSKVIEDTVASMTRWTEARRSARLALVRTESARQAQRSAAAVRRLADRQRSSDPGFASDLYAAADQHELSHPG
jgi:hypothetical protein